MNAQILEAAQKANGSRRSRKIGESEIAEMEELIAQHANDEKVQTIRIYSNEGFVPNSYKYRCDIGVIEARRGADGFTVYGFTVDAKRSRGSGPLVTVNNRAA